MSLEYCYDCDNMIDLDYDSDHEHFNELPEIGFKFTYKRPSESFAEDLVNELNRESKRR